MWWCPSPSCARSGRYVPTTTCAASARGGGTPQTSRIFARAEHAGIAPSPPGLNDPSPPPLLHRDEIKDRLEGLYTGRIVRARESGAPIRPGSPAAPIATRDSGDKDSDKDSAYAASQAAMGAQIRTVEEAREFAADAARYDAAIRATARARGHGAERAAIDGADADPEDVNVLGFAETAGGSRRAPARSRSMV